MKNLLTVVLSVLFVFSTTIAAQNSAQKSDAPKSVSSTTKRKPPFRATTDQIKQAQGILKQRNFYSGDQTGKLDTATREGLKKFQEAEQIKLTGTLNKLTLEKMGITLTEKQRAM